MPESKYKVIKVGVLGCGAIGSGIAKSTYQELKGYCRLTGIFDSQTSKAVELARTLGKKDLCKKTFADLLKSCELLVEATNAKDIKTFIQTALSAKKDVLVMSVGKMLRAQELFSLARQKQRSLLIPSGAIAGIDAIKAASLRHIDRVTLTTRKPLSGLTGIPYLMDKGIDVNKITEETVVFEGDVDSAVKYFPQNINVAATLALACHTRSKITIRILTSPEFQTNSHEIEVQGEFGRMISRTENVISPDNPKTSYLAVLSGIQTLKDFCSRTRIGT